MTHHIQIIFATNCYNCSGSWSIINLHNLDTALQKLMTVTQDTIILNGQNITHLDSAGALLLLQFIDLLHQQNKKVILQKFATTQQALIDLIRAQHENLDYALNTPYKPTMLANIGKETIDKFKQADEFITLLGDLSIKFFFLCKQLQRFRWPDVMANIYHGGVKALPILALLSFLIGVVLTYQMGLQLKEYGANNFIAYLSGMAIFREFAPLITAIIVAGRTSSAFTAQIGSMQLNEEIAAITTMGLSPTELLVIPKMLGLLIAFPLLIFWSDIFNILGSMLISKTILNVSYLDFLIRLQDTVGLQQLMLGLYKAPTFSIIIVLVGCFQGFAVQHSLNNNIGNQTTKSVVQALFLIIIADAVFSVIYSWLGI